MYVENVDRPWAFDASPCVWSICLGAKPRCFFLRLLILCNTSTLIYRYSKIRFDNKSSTFLPHFRWRIFRKIMFAVAKSQLIPAFLVKVCSSSSWFNLHKKTSYKITVSSAEMSQKNPHLNWCCCKAPTVGAPTVFVSTKPHEKHGTFSRLSAFDLTEPGG